MNYIAGTLDRFKAAKEELAKEDRLNDVSTDILAKVEEAVMNRRTFIVVDAAPFDEVAEYFEEDGYEIKYCNDTQVEIRGW